MVFYTCGHRGKGREGSSQLTFSEYTERIPEDKRVNDSPGVIPALANTCTQWNEQNKQGGIHHSTPAAQPAGNARSCDPKQAAGIIEDHIEGVRPALPII